MDYQMNFAFLGLIFSFLGSFFIALVLAKTLQFRKYTEAELKKAESDGEIKELNENAKKDLVHFEINITSRVAPFSTHFAVIGIILLYLGFVFQSLALMSGSAVGLLIIVVCGIIALAFFMWNDL